MIRPTTFMLGPYSHFSPGWNPNGRAASRFAVPASDSMHSCLPVRPEVCVSKWRIFRSRTGSPLASFASLNAEMYFSTGSSTDTLPSSTRIISAVAVIGLVIDMMPNRSSGAASLADFTSDKPRAVVTGGWPASWTSVTAPGISPSAMIFGKHLRHGRTCRLLRFRRNTDPSARQQSGTNEHEPSAMRVHEKSSRREI